MLKYKVIKRKNPKTGASRFYGALISPSPVSLQKLVDRISARTTLSGSDIKAVLDALEYEVIDALADGNVVRMGDLGSFRPTLRGAGVEKEEIVSPECFRKVNVVFTPSLRIKGALDPKYGKVKFAKVSVFEMKKKKGKQGGSQASPPSGGHG